MTEKKNDVRKVSAVGKTWLKESQDNWPTGRKSLENTYVIKDLFKIYKELSRKQVTQFKNWWKDWIDRHLAKEDIQMANKQMKRCSISLTIRELQIQTIVRYYCTYIRMTKIQNNDALNTGGKVFIASGNVKWYILLWKAVWQFLIKLSIFL